MTAKKIGLTSATFLGISSIIGSGWLFAPYRAAQVAGPASLLAWAIGAFVIFLLAMCFAEIAALYPRRGLSAIIPTLSHNKYFGFPFAIANWLGIVAVVALEADATIQYLINLAPNLTDMFYLHDQLTIAGLSLSTVLVLLFSLLNFWGAKLLTKTNNILSVIKLIIPIMVGLIIISVSFHPQNFDCINRSFICYGYSSVFTAILSTGIIVAFNGFQTVISFSSEIKKPARTIPLSLLISMVVCLAVYLLLQTAFIGGVPAKLATQGWKHLQLSAPMIELTGLLGLGMLTSIIYFGATVAPCGTGIAFTGASSRMFTAMSRNKQMPKYFDKVDPRYGVSRPSILLNAALSIVFIFLFRSWAELAQVLSLFHVISYLPIPIALIVFRNAMKGKLRSFIIPGGRVIAFLLFIFFTYLFSMGNFKIVSELMIIFLMLHAVFILVNIRSIKILMRSIKESYILTGYFIYLIMLTYISPHNSHYLTYLNFIIITFVSASIFFFVLTRTEKHDDEIIHSAVGIYKARKEDFSEFH